MLGVVIEVAPHAVVCLSMLGERIEVEQEWVGASSEVGEVVELQVVEGTWLLLKVLADMRPVPCRARPRPQKGHVVFEARDGSRRIEHEVTLEELGVTAAEAPRLQTIDTEFLLVLDALGRPVEVVWRVGGVKAWRQLLAGRDREEEQRKREQALRAARERAMKDDVFVNPYTYVPFPSSAPVRRVPVGHQRLGREGLCGRFDVEIRALTPLLIRFESANGRESGDGQERRQVFPRRDGVPFIPGSSLKGAVRSLHETLTGSCLRVVDLGHLPVYRDRAAIRSGWTLARVDKVGFQNRIEKVQVCDQVAWVRAAELHEALGGPEDVHTGATVTVRATEKNRARVEATEVGPGAGWVLLVTAAGARDPKKPYWCAAGRLSERFCLVAHDAWDQYLAAVDGTDDLRIARQDRSRDLTVPQREPVIHGGETIGHRRTAARGFEVGDVVWVRLSGNRVEEIALSYIWRHPGTGRVGERVPPGFAPCGTPDELCPSCRVLGMADPDADAARTQRVGEEAAEQRAYAGHVRFGDAYLTSGDAKVERVRLAPLGPPRLGAGQFSLEHSGRTEPGDPPTGQWGAALDQGQPRRLRGRRMYWHGDPRSQSGERHRARAHQSGDMTTEVELVDPPAVFTARVYFAGLTRAELGGLLAAVAPDRVLSDCRPPGFTDDGQVALRVGGGKPLGLGSVATSVVGLHVEDAWSRYGGADPPAVTTDDAVAAFLEDAAVVPAVRAEVWPVLAAVLHTGQVNPERIWYPTGTTWDNVGTQGFDASYEYFKRSEGAKVDMAVLPHPSEADQSVAIHPDETGEGTG